MKFLDGKDLSQNDNFFAVLATTEKSQVAVMTLLPGEVSGEYGTDHPKSDQILYVLQGTAVINVEGVELQGSAGAVFLIEAGENHQVSTLGDTPMKSLNIYSPPAYAKGDVEPNPDS